MTRNLGSVIGGGGGQQNKDMAVDNYTSSYQAYLYFFAINLSLQFPFVDDVESIPIEEIEQVAQLTARCLGIGNRVWTTLTGVQHPVKTRQTA